MRKLEDSLKDLTAQISDYQETDPNDGARLIEILQQITALLFFLEKDRAGFHSDNEKMIYKLILSGETVARATNKSAVLLPELYMLRRVMDSAYEVCNAIRTQVSFIKHEMNAAKFNSD